MKPSPAELESMSTLLRDGEDLNTMPPKRFNSLLATVRQPETGATQNTQPQQHVTPYIDGGSFIFDIPDKIPAIWGEGQDVLWAQGESLMIVGPSGVGKTTLTGQIVEKLLFGGELLGYPIPPIEGVVLYLAMDGQHKSDDPWHVTSTRHNVKRSQNVLSCGKGHHQPTSQSTHTCSIKCVKKPGRRLLSWTHSKTLP